MILATLLAGAHMAQFALPPIQPIQYWGYGPPPGYYNGPPPPRFYPNGEPGEYAPYPRYMPRGGMLYPEDWDMIRREDFRMRHFRRGPPMGW